MSHATRLPQSRYGLRWILCVFLVTLCLHMTAKCPLRGKTVVSEEVIDKWKAYESFSRSLQGTSVQTITPDSGKTSSIRTVYEQNRECVRNSVFGIRDFGEICQIANPRYAAKLKKQKLDSEQFVLDQFTLEPGGAFPGTTISLLDLIFHGTSPQFTVGTERLSLFVADSSYKIQKVSKDILNGDEVVRVDYLHTYDQAKTATHERSRGSIFLDPSRCWCVRRARRTAEWTVRGAPSMDLENGIDFETTDHPSGFPIIKSSTSHSNNYYHKTKKRTVSRTRVDYEWEVNDSIPNKNFTLSAFGLPDPVGDNPPKQSSTWLWLITAALGLAGLAVLFAWLRRRRVAMVPEKSSARLDRRLS